MNAILLFSAIWLVVWLLMQEKCGVTTCGDTQTKNDDGCGRTRRIRNPRWHCERSRDYGNRRTTTWYCPECWKRKVDLSMELQKRGEEVRKQKELEDITWWAKRYRLQDPRDAEWARKRLEDFRQGGSTEVLLGEIRRGSTLPVALLEEIANMPNFYAARTIDYDEGGFGAIKRTVLVDAGPVRLEARKALKEREENLSLATKLGLPLTNEIKFACPDCQQHISVAGEMAGTTGQCPGCGRDLVVPHGSAEENIDAP